MEQKEIKIIHFTGIKGVGMTPLAIIAKEAGFIVSGSDSVDIFITDSALEKAGIKDITEFSKKNITNVDLVITTGAHGGFDNEEVVAAKEKGIPVWTLAESLARFMNGTFIGKSYKGISVAGSHGKTTTSAMIATLLSENKKDPSYVVGTSELIPLGLPGHFGSGEYFVVEADEYATEPVYDKTPKLLWQRPQIIVLTNIELDHPDMYATVADVRNVFLKFANLLRPGGVLIVCGDDPEIKKLLAEYQGRVITYGFSTENDYVISHVSSSEEQLSFEITKQGISLGSWHISLMGEHNALNALAALLVGLEVGLSIEQIKQTMHLFKGAKRRSEYIGRLESGAKLFDDYGHHPTEIMKTLTAFRQRFPKKRIICIFQPHTYSRTKALFHEFASSFSVADSVILIDIYSSKREEVDISVSSQLLAEAIKKTHNDITFLPGIQDVVEYLDQKQYKDDTIIITMGAGDVYTIAEKLHIS